MEWEIDKALNGDHFVLSKEHRFSYSIAKLKNSNNYAMMYLVKTGIPTGRLHATINKKVKKAVTVEYGNRIAFWKQLNSILVMAKESYSIEVDPIAFLNEVNKSRVENALNQFMTSKTKDYEKAY